MIHEFKEIGIFCFKTLNNQIGTIIVEPKININSFPVFGDEISKLKITKRLHKIILYLVSKMNTMGLIQFEWKMTDSQDEPILITIDANSSVVPDAAGGLTEIFNCCKLIRNIKERHNRTSNDLKTNFVLYGHFLYCIVINKINRRTWNVIS